MRARFEKIRTPPNRSFYVEERRLARFDAPWHFHPEIELTLIVASRGRRFVGDSIERFGEGDLVLLGPNLPHFWHNDSRQPVARPARAVVVQILPDFLGSDLWTKPEFVGVRRLLARSTRGLHFTGRNAVAAREKLRSLPGRGGLKAVCALFEILEILATTRQVRALASAVYSPNLDRRSEARLARVYGYLISNFSETITLAEVARVAAMTPAAFSRYFKRATGRNVSVFINELRIDHAAKLLSETGRGVAAIAADAGFATLSNFNRRFLERMHCTPREYRHAIAANTASAEDEASYPPENNRFISPP